MNLFIGISVLVGVLAQLVSSDQQLNVLGTPLKSCNLVKVTGYNRSGYCTPDDSDVGTHLFCSKVDQPFLDYTKNQGNDLETPRFSFPGLVPGDNWCLCVFRWVQAYKAGFGPKPVMESIHANTLGYLKQYNIDLDLLKQLANN